MRMRIDPADRSKRKREEGAAPLEPAAGPRLQRSSLPELFGAVTGADRDAGAGGGLLVEDDARPGPGQLRRSEFMAALRIEVCRVAEEELARAGRSADGCPYIEQMLGYYQGRSAEQLERAVRRYVGGEGRGALDARDYLPPLGTRLGRGIAGWARTGRMPEDAPLEALAGPDAAVGAAASTEAAHPAGGLMRKGTGSEPDRVDAGAVLRRLGPGQALDGATQGRMEEALGHSFAGVRVHADHPAATLNQQLSARAFTVGEHVAFGAGELAPGSPAGDALLAHELAHVAQQGTSAPVGEVPLGAAGDSFERDADEAAAEAVEALHARGGARAPRRAPAARPQRRAAGIGLRRCQGKKEEKKAPDPARDAPIVLAYIREEAKARATKPRTVDKASKFYKRLEDHYLKDYLAAPSAAKGADAVGKISKQFVGPATPGDRWEEGALAFWNTQPIPPAFRRLRPALPADLGAATDILSAPNRAHLPLLDVPQLVGALNYGTEFDADVKGGGRNISQLMHWGTGVKYSDVDAKTMRETFLGYEYYHMETFDIFGEDPVNDLISEEQGRQFGVMLRKGEVTNDNLLDKLNSTFAESRAWVGALLRERQAEFDAWIVNPDVKATNETKQWYGKIPDVINPWGPDNIWTKLASGSSVDEVKKWSFTQRVIEIYTLIYEADEWERANKTTIELTSFMKALLRGALKDVLKKVVYEEPLTIGDQLKVLGEVGSGP